MSFRPEVDSWISLAGGHVAPQGLPARSCWLGHRERSRFALAVNELVRDGRLAGPVAFTRDHFDSGGMTHPHIGTETMADGVERHLRLADPRRPAAVGLGRRPRRRSRRRRRLRRLHAERRE